MWVTTFSLFPSSLPLSRGLIFIPLRSFEGNHLGLKGAVAIGQLLKRTKTLKELL